MIEPIRPGLLVLHGNRLELLAETVFAWLRANPLGALEEEIMLVQSNGVAEWLKMNLAEYTGICAATRVELPARFLWRAYRQVLGHDAVPAQSPLDKLPLTWRLMRLLPTLLGRPGYEPLAGFLQRGGLDRRLQLAQRLADLYDQYQVYRSDWLGAWAGGNDRLPAADGGVGLALPIGQQWQAGLWRELLAPLDAEARAAVRPQLHQRFLNALESGAAPASPLPRRVVLFGMSHLPMQTLQALAALSTRCQVLMAVPNPCRFHWADIIEGRELLRFDRRRHALRGDRDLATLDLDEMHTHAHPLLAAWGRQGRDFIRQLDAFDDAAAARQHFALNRIDLFGDAPGQTLLEQVQAHIRDLLPTAEHPRPHIDAADRSIVFHIAHSAQREVEILHDQLLDRLAAPGSAGQPKLRPRDIVVMVPDIETFAPAIRSVFGQYARGDARFIPFDIADLRQRGNNPLLLAIEWLLSLPQQRCRLSELRDLLDVPAVLRRFGIAVDELPRLAAWMQGSGMRWGLDLRQRETLGLGACGEQNSLLFGLRRMLLGYASGDSAAFEAIAPYAEIGGLEAAAAGSLADLVSALLGWVEQAGIDAPPADWAVRLRGLIAAIFDPSDDRERLSIAAFDDALRAWLEACDAAGFDEPVPLAVAREACLSAVDEPGVGRRFRAGGVTFCTLLPMRSIPFEVVCLLGMNDGDYPRSANRSDFDLMALPGQARPGDRSRRHDDRQLMLDALLSARRVLHVSWTGRSVRDNSAQPPSVLVSQLRDYLDAGWHDGVAAQRTIEHPLQPFSRRYFAESPVPVPASSDANGDAVQPPLFTFAREWRAAHEAAVGAAASTATPVTAVDIDDADLDPDAALGIATLARFLRNPVRDFFRNRLAVVFAEEDELAPDDEAFGLGGLQQYQLLDALLKQVLDRLGDEETGRLSVDDDRLAQLLAAPIEQLRLSGDLPIAELGRREADALHDTLLPMLRGWRQERARRPHERPKQRLQFESGGTLIADWLTGLRMAEPDAPIDTACWIELTPSRLLEKEPGKKKDGKPVDLLRVDKLLRAWITTVLAGADGQPAGGIVVGRDATVFVKPIERETAERTLSTLLRVWRDGMRAPLPLPLKTALAAASGKGRLAEVYDGGFERRGEVDHDACLARVFADFDALTADGRFAELAVEVFQPLLDWVGERVTVLDHAAVAPEKTNAASES